MVFLVYSVSLLKVSLKTFHPERFHVREKEGEREVGKEEGREEGKETQRVCLESVFCVSSFTKA